LKDNKRLILGLGGAPVILLSLVMLFNFALVNGKLSFLECTKHKNLLMGKRGVKCTTRFSGSENHAWRLKGFFQKTFTKKIQFAWKFIWWIWAVQAELSGFLWKTKILVQIESSNCNNTC
jgi:hypothetical protein